MTNQAIISYSTASLFSHSGPNHILFVEDDGEDDDDDDEDDDDDDDDDDCNFLEADETMRSQFAQLYPHRDLLALPSSRTVRLRY
jgi:hypothetical protein